MAKRKTDLAKGNIGGFLSTDFQKTLEQEQNILTNTLNNVASVKNTKLTILSGAKTEIVYFHQITSDKNNHLVNLSGMNFSDPNLSKYAKIDRFIVKMMDAIDVGTDTVGEGQKSLTLEGKLQILPNTILPLANDYFLMLYRERICLFRVNEVTPLTADKETVYELSYHLEFDNFVYENSELKGMVSEEYVFEQAYIGTDFRTVFKSDEYSVLNNLRDLYNDISIIYYDNFYDKTLNTYFLRYENNLESKDESNFITITEDGSKEVVKQPTDSSIFVKMLLGRQLYDAELIDFMRNNRIFDEINGNSIYPAQYATNRKISVYNSTLFSAIESRDRFRFRNKYFLPLELNIATPASQPVMFGKINLIHVSALNDTTISLYPPSLYDSIIETTTDVVVPLNYSGNTVFDKIIRVISLYLNKFDRNLISYLLNIQKNIDDLQNFESFIYKNEAFYIFPILGYIIRYCTDKLVDKELQVEFYESPK
jgi:hypothetical protein